MKYFISRDYEPLHNLLFIYNFTITITNGHSHRWLEVKLPNIRWPIVIHCLFPGSCSPSSIYDLGLVIDGSGSETYLEFVQTQIFVINLIDLFKIGSDGTQVGVIVYSNKAKLVFSLSQFHDPVELQLQLLRLQLQEGSRRIDLALKKAGSELFSDKEGDRKKVPDVLVVITTGNTIKNSEPYEDVLKPLKVPSCWSSHFLKRYDRRNELYPWANHSSKQTHVAVPGERVEIRYPWKRLRGKLMQPVISAGNIFTSNHKNYNFLACYWFKKVLFSTNSLAKLLSDSLLLDSLLLDSLLSDSSKSQSHSKM